MAAYDFTSVDAVRAYKGITGSGTDDIIGRLIPLATAQIQGYLHRLLYQDTWTEPKNGGGDFVLAIERPIVSVTTLHDSVDGTFNASTLVAASDYSIDKKAGIVRLRWGRNFCSGHQNVQLVYVGGYAAVPPAVEQVCIELVCMQIEARNYLTTSSVTHGDGSRTVVKGPWLTPEHKRILQPYRNEVAS